MYDHNILFDLLNPFLVADGPESKADDWARGGQIGKDFKTTTTRGDDGGISNKRLLV